MNIRWIGAILMIAGCGGVGFGMARNYKREEAALAVLVKGLTYMGSELEYRLTPLPELCRKTGEYSGGSVGNVFQRLAQELDRQVSPDVFCCMSAVLQNAKDLPGKAEEAFRELGRSLGQFDLEGQMEGLALVKRLCEKELKELGDNRSQRIRSYQTLGLCAGAALAILFV